MNRAFNHMKTWDRTMLADLVKLAESKQKLRTITRALGRTGTSVVAKLQSIGMITRSDGYHRYTYKDGELFCTDHQLEETDRYMQMPLQEGELIPTVASLITQTTEQEQDMTTINIDKNSAVSVVTIDDNNGSNTVTYIYGKEAPTVSDDQIFQHIAELENQIEALSRIKTKPKKLTVKLEAMQNDIEALVTLVDER